MPNQYRITWRSTLTGKTGHGERTFSLAEAQGWCEILDGVWPNLLHHWPELLPALHPHRPPPAALDDLGWPK